MSRFVVGVLCGFLAQALVALWWPATDWIVRVALGTAVTCAVSWGMEPPR